MEKLTLKNGAQLVVAPNPANKSFTLLVLFKTGSRNDPKKYSGISHFIEHMIFKGTKKRNNEIQVMQEIDSMGAIGNAFTGHEYTGYFVKVESSHSAKAFDLLSDMVRNPLIPSNAIPRERDVIKEELKMNIDDPSRRVLDEYYSLIFKGSSLGRSIVGTNKSLDFTTRKAMLDYIYKQYDPKEMIVITAGGITLSKAKKLANGFFSYRKKNLYQADEEYVSSQKKYRLKVQYKNNKQANLCFGYSTEGYRRKNNAAVEVLNSLLGATFSSRLWREIRMKKGLAYDIRSYLDNLSDGGSVYAYSGVNSSKIEEALIAIDKEFKKLKTRKVGNDELKRAKDSVVGRLALSLESTDKLAMYYAEHVLYETAFDSFEDHRKAILSVTAEDIQNYAKKNFVKNKLNVAIVGPYKNEAKIKKVIDKF